MAFTVGGLGLGVLVNVGKLLLTLYIALIVFGACVSAARRRSSSASPSWVSLRAVAEPATIAFATAASQAALPSAMEQMEAFGVPRRIVAFVIPAGYSFNLDGSTLYLAVTAIFIAQAGGMHLSIGATARDDVHADDHEQGRRRRAALDVRRPALPPSTFHLPMEPIFVLLGVDTVMDMGAHRRQRRRQLPRQRRRRQMGERLPHRTRLLHCPRRRH